MEPHSLEQSHKMELLGRLAGGITHDINSMLAAIAAYSDLVLRRLPEADPALVEANVREIRAVAFRAATLTNHILSFSRRKDPKTELVDLNAVILSILPMLRHVIPMGIELATNLAPELPRVRAVTGQIEQVILNLAVNGRDAMTQGGRLSIDTSNARIDGKRAAVLGVTDTGSGMDKSTLRHLFEPYFTTKDLGTGFGLSTVYEIIKSCAGTIEVKSEPGQGTIFRIFFPYPDASETILLVEDNEAIRNSLERALQYDGYTVLTAENGASAINLCAGNPGPIHLMITDLRMPDMNGIILAKKARAARPDLRILFMSGEPPAEDTPSFIQKPFSCDALSARVRELLDYLPSIPT